MLHSGSSTWKVRLEEVDLPNLRISPLYREMLASADTPAETREYIKRKINSAQWLIDAIEQRRSTLQRTAQAIVDHQTRFLTDGPEAIEPLKMQQIADRIGMHVTTVSRAVDDKWLQTPRGLVPLRRFFVGGTISADGDEVAWDTVRIKLLAIFRSRPSPFCILDEVDAALDEANVDRFVGVLREFPDTQIILVTHRKATMAAADTLYGVTMEEAGVSRRVSVRFEKAPAAARAAPRAAA